VANTLRELIEDFRFSWGGKNFNVGASFGLVPITKASKDRAEVLSAADSACYAAKEQGRNRIHIYQQDDAELVRWRGQMQWVSSINRALEEDRLKLYFQSIVPIKRRDDEREHYELLIRMEDENGRLVPPGAFLPAAERYNLATKLDRWVIGTALRWLSRHPQHLERLSLCFINLSGQSLGDQGLLRFVSRLFDEMKIPSQKICFEVTETAAIANLSSATSFIKELKLRGCRFALDDFGSGLSSFAYLKSLPVDFLKIDGLFVKDIMDDSIDLAMVRSINDIGHVMGKQTIAEFVENKAILERLRQIGVDYAQGYGIGRPRALAEML
jgi:EAL domain-containing protein (putative c-di-GMP-specific phosphodiesterase class I)